jgi:chromosome segregation ATPase
LLSEKSIIDEENRRLLRAEGDFRAKYEKTMLLIKRLNELKQSEEQLKSQVLELQRDLSKGKNANSSLDFNLHEKETRLIKVEQDLTTAQQEVDILKDKKKNAYI